MSKHVVVFRKGDSLTVMPGGEGYYLRQRDHRVFFASNVKTTEIGLRGLFDENNGYFYRDRLKLDTTWQLES